MRYNVMHDCLRGNGLAVGATPRLFENKVVFCLDLDKTTTNRRTTNNEQQQQQQQRQQQQQEQQRNEGQEGKVRK
jgi:hypothetical protein